MGRALARTFMARAVAALGSIMLAIVIGRLFGPSGMGLYALAYSILLGVGTLSRQGMDNGLVRFVGRDHLGQWGPLYLGWAIRRALILSGCLSVFVFFLRGWLEDVYDAEGLSEVLLGIALASPAYTLGFVFSGFFKAVRKPATGALLENGSIALVSGLFILSGAILIPDYDVGLIGYSYAVAAWLIALQAALQAKRWCSVNVSSDDSLKEFQPVSKKGFMRTSRDFLITNMARLMQSVLGVMTAGFVLNSAELGYFKSAQQVAVLISFVLVVINAVFPPRFAALYHRGEMSELAKLARQGVVLGTLIATPFLLVCLVWPSWVLSWFGEGFSAAENLLRVIAISQLVNVMTGSVGFLLNMTGHEKLMRNISLLSNFVGLLAFATLPYLFGAIGAAFALSIIMVLQNVLAMFFVWRRLGIWTIPSPRAFLLPGSSRDIHE